VLLAGWLKMERNRIVDAGQDASFGEQASHTIAVWYLDYVDIKGMLRPWRGLGCRGDNTAQCVGVGRRMFPSRLVPAIKIWELDAQNRCLYLVHSPVGAHHLMFVTDARPVVTHHAHSLSKFRIVGNADACFAIRAEGLAAIQAEAADVADATNRPTLVGSAVRL